LKKTVTGASFILVFLTASCLINATPAWAATTTENTWTTKTSAPFAGRCEAAVVNGKIYVISSDTSTASTYEYDPETDMWTPKKPMPTPRAFFALASCQNKIYVIGGINYSSPHTGATTKCPLNEVYDPETDTWETGEPMPTARSQIRAEAVNGKIYVISGRTGDQYTTVRTNEAYDPETDSWETKAEIPYHVASGGSTVLDDKIYVIGGQNEFHDPMNPGFVQIYDPVIDAWTQGTTHPSPAWLGEVVVATTGLHAPKRIYVMGGSAGIGRATNASYVYDPELDVWTVGASMPFPRQGFALVAVDDVLYAIGGFNGWTTGYSDNQRYVPFGYGTIPLISSPENNGNYTSSSVPLTFELSVEALSLSYSLDGGVKVPLVGNTTLNGLADGEHVLTIYATDDKGNTSTLQTISFKVDSIFTMILVISTIVIVAVVCTALLVYFKKRKR